MTTNDPMTLYTTPQASPPLNVSGLSDVNARLIRGIHAARPDEVRQALEQGADVNLRDPNRRGQSPLAQSALYLRAFPVATEVHELLLNAGANVNACDDAGQSVLDQALLFEQPALANTLLDRGATARPVEVIESMIPAIAVALTTHNTPLVRRLLNAGACVPSRWGTQPMLLCVLDKVDRSPLDPPALLDLVNLVMDRTPPLTATELRQALFTTVNGGDHAPVVQHLIDAGASLAPIDAPQTVFLEDVSGEITTLTATRWSLLHAAAGEGRSSTLDLLLALGMDPLQVAPTLDSGALTAIDVARGSGHRDLMVRMEQHVLQASASERLTLIPPPARARL